MDCGTWEHLHSTLDGIDVAMIDESEGRTFGGALSDISLSVEESKEKAGDEPVY